MTSDEIKSAIGRAKDRINQLKQMVAKASDSQERRLVKSNLEELQFSLKRCLRWWALDSKPLRPDGQRGTEAPLKKESLLPPHLKEIIRQVRREKRKKKN